MIPHDSVLVQLVGLVDRLPAPNPSTSAPSRRRGRPFVYSDSLFLKALVIMTVRRLHKVGELLAARLTPANVHDGRVAPLLIEELPREARFVLGDKGYDAKGLKRRCLEEGRFMVSPKRGVYPHTDPGAEVRRIFHLLRHRAIENLNGHFKALFDCQGSVPTKGQADAARFALGAVFVYQLALLHRHHERHSDTNAGLKAFLRAA
jgi:hypothetical protein